MRWARGYAVPMDLALSLLVLIVGLVLYVVASHPKPSELGRIMFAMGLLVALLRFVGFVSLR